MGRPLVSVLIPSFGHRRFLPERMRSITMQTRPPDELIVIDDGSTDGSAELALNAGVSVIRHPYNIGNGAAIKSGIRAARGQTLIFMDGDGQHRPEDIPKLLRESGRYHMVVGERAKGSKLRFHRNAANILYNSLASYVTHFKVRDLTSGFRVVSRRDALRFIDLLPNTFSYPTTLTLAFLRSGLTVKYVPIQSLYRAGQSKITLLSDGIRFLLIITKIATLFSPFRIFLPVSMFFFFAGIANYIHTYVTQYRFTNMSVFLLTTSVVVFMLGLISEQIALLRMERQPSSPDMFSDMRD